MLTVPPHFWLAYVRSGRGVSDKEKGGWTMLRIATLVLAGSLAAAAQEKKPIEPPSLDTNVAPEEKGATPPKTDKAPGKSAGKPVAKKTGGPPAAKPDPALTATFGGFVGTWRCTGSMTLPPDMGGQEMKTRSQMAIRRDLRGFAYSGDFRMEPQKDFPGMRGRILWTYDSGAKKFYELSVDDGGGIVRGESGGMQDGKMVWSEQGAMMGKPTKNTTTIVTKGKNQIEIQFSAQGDGGWTMSGTDRCRKT